MASNIYRQDTADGKSHLAIRSIKQGRRPLGLADKKQFRLYQEDFDWLKSNWTNANDFVRNAVHAAITSVHTELLNH